MRRVRAALLPTIVTLLLVAASAGAAVATAAPSAAQGASAAVLSVAPATQLAYTAPKRPHPHGTPPPKRPHPHRKPWPVTITVQTAPVLAGMRFSWDGKVITTDSRGRASVTAEHNFALHTLVAMDKIVARPQQQFRFVRWAGQRDPQLAFKDTVTGLPMRGNYTVTAGYSVQYPVTARFVDQKSAPVDPKRIAKVTVRTETGTVQSLPVSGTIWLDGIVPLYRGSSLDTREASYSIQSVMVSGTNTVDVGQQSFKPAKTSEVVVTTKFFDLTVRAHDLLYHSDTGTSAQVTFPDGTVHQVPFGADGSGTLTNLPRGVYNVDIKGAGTAIPAQVTLSRDASADLVVATRGDMATLGGAGLGIAAALLLFGRGRRGLVRALTTSVLGRLGLRPVGRRVRAGARA